MKKIFVLPFLFLLATTLSYAQPVIETEGGSGIDVMSVVIGLVVGLVIGYVVASRMSKK